MGAEKFDKEKRYGETFDLPKLTESNHLIEIRCYESSVFLVNHCTILTYDTSFAITRKTIQYRPFDSTKYSLIYLNDISTMNPDSIFKQLVEAGIFSFSGSRMWEKERMFINKNNEIEVFKGLIGVLDGTTYRIDIKVGDTYKSIFTDTTRTRSAAYFPDDFDLKREKAIVDLLEAKPRILAK